MNLTRFSTAKTLLFMFCNGFLARERINILLNYSHSTTNHKKKVIYSNKFFQFDRCK